MPQKISASTAPTRKRDRAATEARLLEVGETVFSRYGFKAATTKLISQESGVNEGLIARYFGGKDGLLFAIVEKHVKEARTDGLPYAPASTLRSELRNYVSYRFDECLGTIEFFKIVVTQFLVDETFPKRMRELVPRLVNDDLQSRVQALVASKDVSRLLESLETHLMGAMIVRVLMMGEKVQHVRESVLAYADDCALLLMPTARRRKPTSLTQRISRTIQN